MDVEDSVKNTQLGMFQGEATSSHHTCEAESLFTVDVVHYVICWVRQRE